MTAFFSDVRGFTTISEKLPPEELSRVLNLYLTPMTDIVFKNSGTLDKYMGDAIMAFFGAPVKDPHHAAHACRCALESLVKLKELQKRILGQGSAPYRYRDWHQHRGNERGEHGFQHRSELHCHGGFREPGFAP
ncbi:adenylate/guanylate cyclase domain-containing protein [Bdellovibrio bacteriovorus]|uniref:adenylate/guanylate cyclase domain-containing protein n=1 Tax=Bdellovibrio bacteriovorus TaxID=959 RepID=UPI0035A64F6D